MEDPEIIEVFDTVSKLGGVAFVNAENDVVVREGEKKMLAAGISGPEGHAMAHPEEAEVSIGISPSKIGHCSNVNHVYSLKLSCELVFSPNMLVAHLF